MNDLKRECAAALTEEEVIAEIVQQDNMGLAWMFAKKLDARFGQFKYHSEDIAKFLGYNRSDKCGSLARCLIELMTKGSRTWDTLHCG